MSFISETLSGLFGFFNKGAESVVGIDIGASSIKVVELKEKAGQAVLLTYGELALGPYAGTEIGRATNLPTDRLSEALKDVLREAKVRSRKCGIAIPLPSSLVSLIEVPMFNKKQLAQIIPIEARKYIPVPISEVTLDWWLVPKDEQVFRPESAEVAGSHLGGAVAQKTDVLIVAIHNEAISRYRELSATNNLDTSFFEIEIFSTMRGVLDQGLSSVMILDMGAGSTKLYIAEHGIIRSSHTINRGGQDLTLAIAGAVNIPISQAEELKRSFGLSLLVNGVDLSQVMVGVLSHIFSEANRVLLNYQKKYNRNISKVVLSGGGVNLKGLAELAQRSFQVPAELANPFAKVSTPAFLAKVLENAGPEFAVAIGIALRRLQESE